MDPSMTWLLFLLLLHRGWQQGVLLPVLGILVPVYLFPWLIALWRAHPQSVPILLLTLFLGWTGLGWVVALIWSAWHFEGTSLQSGLEGEGL
jgi:Superinfection immunity protein